MTKIKTYNVAKEAVMNVGLPIETRTYKPIGHNQLIDLTLESIHQAGFMLDKETYSSTKEGQVANGRYTISNIADSEMQIQIAWQNSLNKKISLKYALGIQVFICANGAVSGDMGAFKKKHQGDVQEFTPRYIVEYIKTAGDAFLQMQKDREVLKSIEVDRHLASQLVGQMYIENQIIEATQMNIIKREIYSPTYDYGAPNSMWELMQFTTFALREVHPTLWMDSHMNVHKFFMEQSGIVHPVRKDIIVEPVSPFTQLDLFEELYNV